jgi:dynein heavy chain 1
MKREEVLPFLKEFLSELLYAFTDAEEEAFRTLLKTEKSNAKIAEFLDDQHNPFLAFSYDTQAAKLRVASDIQKITSGQTVIVFRKGEFRFPLDCSVPSILKQSVHVYNAGEVNNDFNPVLLALSGIKNGIMPLLKNSEEVKEEELRRNEDVSIATTFVKSAWTMNLLQNNFNDLYFLSIKQTSIKAIPEVTFSYDEVIVEACAQAAKKGRPAGLEDISPDLLKKDSWISSIQESFFVLGDLIKILFNHWTEVNFETLNQEIDYWAKYQVAVEEVCRRLEDPENDLILKVIKTQRRTKDITDIANALQTQKHLELVKSVNGIIREIPVDKLENAKSISEMSNAMLAVFNQIKRLFDNNNYKPVKIQNMLNNFSQDLTAKVVGFFQPLDILRLPVKEYDAYINDYSKLIVTLFTSQNNQMKNYMNQSASFSGMGAGTQLKSKINRLTDRLKTIQACKTTQESFQKIVNQISSQEEAVGEKTRGFAVVGEAEIQEIFRNAFPMNIFDLSPEGDQLIDQAKKKYDEKIEAIEKHIIIKIRSLLGSAKSQNEMFAIFSRFSEILKRPQFQVSLSEYQDHFVKRVFENSAELYSKYKRKAGESGAKDICRFYGIYPSTCTFIRFDQLYSHFVANKQKIETVMGDKFKNTQKEQELESISNNFNRAKENEDAIKKINITDKDLDGRLLTIEMPANSSQLKLSVNFSESNRNVIEDLRYFIKNKQYGVVNLTTVYYFKKNTLTVFMNALKLFEIVKIWNHLIKKIDEKGTMLLSSQLRRVYAHIEQGLRLEWITSADRNQDRESYFAKFLDSVLVLEEAVEKVSDNLLRIDEFIRHLSSPESNFEDFQKDIAAIQEIMDDLLLKEFTNTELIVKEINGRIERVFSKRLAETLTAWTEEFSKFKNDPRLKNKNRFIQRPTVFEFTVRGTKILIDPPIQQARLNWLEDLHSHVHKFTGQKKILVNRYQAQSVSGSADGADFSDLLNRMNPQVVASAYRVLHEKVNAAEAYVRKWKSYEALWGISLDAFYARFGDNLRVWQQVLNEIKQGRNTFDTTQVNINYGPIIINYKQVQNRINNVYDQLHKQVLAEFGNRFSKNMKEIVDVISEKKEKLDNLNFASSADLVENISIMNHCRKNIDKWKENIEQSSDIERLLIQQKYHFGEDYRNAAQLSKDFAKFLTIYQAKNEMFENNIESFKSNLAKEEEMVAKKTAEIEGVWNNKKPFSPDMNTKEAAEIIASLETTIQENQLALSKLNQAKTLIGLPEVEADTMNVIIEDLQTLKEIWALVAKVWEPLEVMFDTPFNACNPMQHNKTFDGMSEQLQEVPQKLRAHPIIVGKRKEIQGLKKKNRMIGDIKNDAIKDQHLVEIFKKVNIKKAIPDVTVRDIFGLNLEANEKAINEIVAVAQGELVLENMLKKIKTFWHEEKFQVSKYQNKTSLIKGWDEMMTRAEEDIGQLTSMKLSQHFKTFETDIKSWHEKILNLSTTLGVWMEVQRKWVYLENIFLGSSDIKSQLSSEYERFQTIDRDFLNIMKQMASKLRILEVVTTIPNLLKSLEFISETLDKLQKSLTDYLESQRQAFPRFYFVGDDDLLEIIGNSKEIGNVQKYFSKMFAGINSIENEEHGDLLVGMTSKENEKVAFQKAFKISAFSKINLWLNEIVDQMQTSLAVQLENCIASWKECSPQTLKPLVEKYPTQTILLALQTFWTFLVEEQIAKKASMSSVVKSLIGYLAQMAEEVLKNMEVLTRKRYEQLITELVHKRDVSRKLEGQAHLKVTDFVWSYFMRYYLVVSEKRPAFKLKVSMGNSEFVYGHEYLGITDKLVQTPLTDKCYFTLTQALWLRMGGAPFGPAGTGKTESVKALGCNLGRFVLVFNCDETFNFKAMGRIFIGLCQVGAWGCFDEFNRLEERILSAVSQTILTIQTGLRENNLRLELLGRAITLNVNLGIFVTMNPGYAGRSNLPENLKQLFRQMAMIKPDSVLIAQVMLFSQGFKSAEELSGKVVSLFELCADQLSSQPHYDFGLRSLKSVLNSAGVLKRRMMAEASPETNPHSLENEQVIILRSYCDTVVPKLISDDSPLLKLLIKGVFPTANVPPIENAELLLHLKQECERKFLMFSNEKFIEKVLQLNQILKLQHGVMLVGPTGCGKTAAWKSLLASLTKLDGVKGESYVIDPKAITKDELYGRLDNTTMEWTDGIFTHIIRRICENQRGESSKRHWVVFDGDVDPEWAENLNSVLDDNKLLTLPNGERLPILSNVKIMFEVESLKYATLATVSRCGMAWFSEDILEDFHIYHHYLERLKEDNFDTPVATANSNVPNDAALLRERCADFVRPLFFREDHGKPLVSVALELAAKQPHVMEYSRIRLLEAFMVLVRKGIDRVVEMDEIKFGNYASDAATVEKYMLNWTVLSMNWAFVGDLKLAERAKYFDELRGSLFELPPNLRWPDTDSSKTLIDYEVRIEDGEFSLWKLKVPELNLPSEKVTNADTIIPTVDTLRHQDMLCSWLQEHRPFIICGPPGSGKTMTLMSTLKSLQDFDMIFVNFSSSTTPPLSS